MLGFLIEFVQVTPSLPSSFNKLYIFKKFFELLSFFHQCNLIYFKTWLYYNFILKKEH